MMRTRAYTLAIAMIVIVTVATAPSSATHANDPACFGSEEVDLQALGGDPASDRFGEIAGSKNVDLRALGGDPAGHDCTAVIPP